MAKSETNASGHRQRLRDRFERSGLDGFAEYEVVELLLTLALPRGDVKPTAKELIRRFHNLRGILDAPLEDLRAVDRIGVVTPVALKVVRETAQLYLQQQAEGREQFADPEALSRFWRLKIGAIPREVFEVAYLDSGLRLLRDGVERLEEGTVDRAAVYPRQLMEAAIRRSAQALIVAHNHPNGDVQPSEQDKTLTRALALAGATLQIKVHDHLIVSIDNTFSFREAGLL